MQFYPFSMANSQKVGLVSQGPPTASQCRLLIEVSSMNYFVYVEMLPFIHLSIQYVGCAVQKLCIVKG
jgi:hypothetical protein